MADFTAGPNGSGIAIHAGKYVNLAAAAVSVALMIGVGVWGYKLLMRDVTGVPVVRAIVGEMRVSPETPGGEIAAHIGLSVNSVPADGGAAQPQDRLVLAPNSTTLRPEDLEVSPNAAAAEMAPALADPLAGLTAATLSVDGPPDANEPLIAAATPVDPTTPMTAADILALADQIASGAAPMGALANGETVPVAVSVNGVSVNPDVLPDAVPGVRVSLRPSVRPGNRVVAVSAPAPAIAAPVTGEVTTAALAVGTNLVQLGAYDSADIAATEWVRLSGRFPDFFDGKDQIIQQAQSGGRTFYRLRAQGFADLSDARRFCAEMSAQDAACIPVVVR